MTTWAEWSTHATMLAVADLHIATYDLGDPAGKPLTFLHGYPSSSLDVAPTWDVLERDTDPGWRLLTLDMPGFGASDKPVDHPHSIHAATDAVEAMWAARNVTHTLVAAHDYSVSVAQELLARRAEGALATRIDGIVFMNGGLYPDLHRQTVGQQLLLSEEGEAFAASMTQDMFVSGIAGTWGTRVPFDEAEMREMHLGMAASGGVQQMHRLLHYIADRREHADRWRTALESTDLPLAFAWGDLDPVSGAHVMERIVPRFPHADIKQLADVGHWPPLEAPDVVADVIRRTASRAGI